MFKRLTPRQLFTYAARNIEARNVIHERLKYPFPADPDFYAVSFLLANEKVFLMHPACDFDRITLTEGNAGTIPLPNMLEHIVQLKMGTPYGENATFIVPLAECRKRAHWTFLKIKGNQVYFYDPRPRLPSILSSLEYSLKPTQDYLKKFGYTLHTENLNYLGLQPWLDDQYCGYFVGYAIYSLLTHKVIPTITIEEVLSGFLNPPIKNIISEAKVLSPVIVVERFKEEECKEVEECKEEESKEDASARVILETLHQHAGADSTADHELTVVCVTPVPTEPEEKWLPLQYESYEAAASANSSLTSVELGARKQKENHDKEPLTPFIREALNSLPDFTTHPGLSAALKQFDALINDKKYWKTKSHFTFEIPRGLQRMQNATFDTAKKIAGLQIHKKKSLLQLFTCYDSRDRITHLLYKSLNAETSLYDLFSNAAFNEVLKDYADWQTKHTLLKSTTRVMR